jgi:hypothetical protein
MFNDSTHRGLATSHVKLPEGFLHVCGCFVKLNLDEVKAKAIQLQTWTGP